MECGAASDHAEGGRGGATACAMLGLTPCGDGAGGTTVCAQACAADSAPTAAECEMFVDAYQRPFEVCGNSCAPPGECPEPTCDTSVFVGQSPGAPCGCSGQVRDRCGDCLPFPGYDDCTTGCTDPEATNTAEGIACGSCVADADRTDCMYAYEVDIAVVPRDHDGRMGICTDDLQKLLGHHLGDHGVKVVGLEVRSVITLAVMHPRTHGLTERSPQIWHDAPPEEQCHYGCDMSVFDQETPTPGAACGCPGA